MQFELLKIKSAEVIDDKAYFVPGNMESIICLNLRSLCIEQVHSVEWNTKPGAVNVIKKDEILYFISTYGAQVVVFDPIESSIRNYVYADKFYESTAVYEKNNDIYIFPRKIPGEIVVFNCSNNSFKVNKCTNISEDGKILTSCIINEEFIYNFYNSSKIYISKFPFRESHCLKKFDSGIRSVSSGISANKILLTMAKKGEIVSYDLVTDDMIIEDRAKEEIAKVFEISDDYYCSIRNKLCKCDGDCLKVISEMTSVDNTGTLFSSYIQYEDSTIFLPWNAYGGLIMDSDNNCKLLSLNVSIYDRAKQGNNFVEEMAYRDIADFISYVQCEGK